MAKTKDDFKMQRDAAHGISSSEPKVKEKRSMKYLDPKTDLTFKKIFYKHPDLLISLLNEIEARRNSDKNRAANDDFLLIERYLDNIGEPSSDSLPYDISSAAIADYEWDDADECETSDSDEQDALIDSFIEAEKKGELFVPKVQNVEENSPQEMDSLSLKKIREKAFLSESLAKLYVKQHKYEQALAIFSSLNLKYSKKFTYFAHQIRYLETILSYEKGEESK